MHDPRRSSKGTEDSGEVPFADAWETHQRAVYRACLTLLGGRRDDADEVFSRVAMQAFQKWPRRWNDDAHAKAWLLAVARNACVDLHRERMRSREVSLDAAAHDRAAPTELITAATDPERALLRAEDRRRLRCTMRRLPARLRVVAEMHFVTEMSYRDIARELGISEPNVRKRVQHARAALRHGIDAIGIATRNAGERGRAEAPAVAVPVQVTCGASLPRRRDALQRYIAHHPRGWRKRLELARTLAAMREFDEAALHYRYVVARQPFPLQPWIELGAVLEALGSVDEAAEAYAEGARQAGRERDREQLRGLAAAAGRARGHE
ncbi:MAG TPA: sigma-70 family RNA polymerase sigma factor [Thermoanaerobaculia bacterium]|nr:sigma-70 family RNA polymerase sigma factor [Thermoanaerobaculia bacterium]